MTNTLTNGFDLSIQASESMINEVLVGSYWLNSIAQVANLDLQDYSGGIATIHVYPPYIAFFSGPDNPVQILCPQGIYVRNALFCNGCWSLATSISSRLQEFEDQSSVIIDLESLPDEAFDIQVKNDIPDDQKTLILSCLRGSIINGFRQIGKITVLSAPQNKFFRVKNYDLSSLRGMALLLRDQPAEPEGPVLPFIRAGQDYAIAISSEYLQPILDRMVAPYIGRIDDSTVLNDLKLRLVDKGIGPPGKTIEFRGRVTKEIDCWPDAVLDFLGWVYVSIDNNGNLNCTLGPLFIDLPWWLDILEWLLPFIGSIILAIIRYALGSIGSMINTDQLSDMPIFLPVNFEQGELNLRTKHKDIEVRSTGMILSGDASVEVDWRKSGPSLSIESYGQRGWFIRHKGEEIELAELNEASTQSEREDATFTLVAGFGNRGCLSFESLNRPAHFIRWRDAIVQLSDYSGLGNFNKETTFRIVPGLADPVFNSFQVVDDPTTYLHVKNNKLVIEKGSGSRFNSDATFNLTYPLAIAEAGYSTCVKGRLLRRGYCGGRIYGPEPWPNVPVVIKRRDGMHGIPVTQGLTDSDGRFCIDGIPIGITIYLVVSEPSGDFGEGCFEMCELSVWDIYTGLTESNCTTGVCIDLGDLTAQCFVA